MGDFLSQLRRTDLAKRGGKDEVEMAADDFGEGVLGGLQGVTREQLQVGVAHFTSISPPPPKPDKEN